MPWDMKSGGRQKDLSLAHVTSLDQSYFFIYRINYMRNNILPNFRVTNLFRCNIVTNIRSYLSTYRTVKSVISVWMDTYPDDFRDDPDYTCLRTLEEFSKVHVPDSDLATRARHKMEKFQREAEGKSGTVIYIERQIPELWVLCRKISQ